MATDLLVFCENIISFSLAETNENLKYKLKVEHSSRTWIGPLTTVIKQNYTKRGIPRYY